jgi:hypothetical protein
MKVAGMFAAAEVAKAAAVEPMKCNRPFAAGLMTDRNPLHPNQVVMIGVEPRRYRKQLSVLITLNSLRVSVFSARIDGHANEGFGKPTLLVLQSCRGLRVPCVESMGAQELYCCAKARLACCGDESFTLVAWRG